jgi:hypothetical protein
VDNGEGRGEVLTKLKVGGNEVGEVRGQALVKLNVGGMKLVRRRTGSRLNVS